MPSAEELEKGTHMTTVFVDQTAAGSFEIPEVMRVSNPTERITCVSRSLSCTFDLIPTDLGMFVTNIQGPVITGFGRIIIQGFSRTEPVMLSSEGTINDGCLFLWEEEWNPGIANGAITMAIIATERNDVDLSLEEMVKAWKTWLLILETRLHRLRDNNGKNANN